jgi:DNA modification methylase
LQILRSLPSSSIDLIYIDPPFFSGRIYNQVWGDNNEVRTFNDIWDGGLPTYLIWLNARLWEMKRVLKETGSIYVHLDWHASHYVKCEMDKIFGYGNFLNEIIIHYTAVGLKAKSKKFHQNTEPILSYAKNKYKNIWNDVIIPATPRKASKHVFNSVTKKAERVRNAEGKIEYFEIMEQKADNFMEIAAIRGSEKIGYPTQKSIALLERIIKASSNQGDIVADFFCGGGTTLAVAQKLKRRFIGSDISRVAVSVTLDRLIRDAEQATGQKASTDKSQKQMQGMLPTVERVQVPDIKIYYHGVYPVNKFESLSQDEFDNFILTCFSASKNTVEDGVSGFKNQFNPILVGPVSQDDELTTEQVKKFVQSVIKNHIQQNQRYCLTILAWRFQPQVKEYVRQLGQGFFKKLQDQGVVLEIELIPIRNHQFRERITSHIAIADQDKEDLLQFIESPLITEIIYHQKQNLTYEFEAIAKSINIDGYLINCQWDFNFQGGNFSEPKYSLNRERKNNRFEAILKTEKTFEKAGDYKIACKVQDNFGGEAVKVVEVNIRLGCIILGL